MEDRYLKLLSKKYPTKELVRCEIVDLLTQNCMPKGTEYFFSDLHGEEEGFRYLLQSASGIIKEKVSLLLSDRLSAASQNQLVNLIYAPEEVISLMHAFCRDTVDWMKETIPLLLLLCREVSSKYPKHRVRSKLPEEYRYLVEELLYPGDEEGKKEYVEDVINAIVDNAMGDTFIPVLAHLIQSLTVDTIHVIGDIFDRGPGPHRIMEELIRFKDVDIQWGNHDVSWMGAACGNPVLVANVVRMGISYNTFDCLEDGYGINLRPLSAFAAKVYKEDPCERFLPKMLDSNRYDKVDRKLAAKMHKAISIIQFKLAGQMVHRRPEFCMGERSLLEQIDYERGVLVQEEKEYPLLDVNFPTVDPTHPLELTSEEAELMKVLVASFCHSEELQRHIRFLYTHGSAYKICNGNLLFHGCIPMNPDGSFESLKVRGESCSGKNLFDCLDRLAREAYFLPKGSEKREEAVDWMWYLWCGACSPMFGKSKLAAFESYFIEAPELKKEVMNPYYKLSEQPETCRKILAEFGMDSERGHIINGHVPVKIKNGEKPIKADGMLYVIDGGLSKAYQSKTGIAGYTMIFNSHYLALAEHHNLMAGQKAEEAISIEITERMPKRLLVRDTDQGKEILLRVEDLKKLLELYEEGIYIENEEDRQFSL